MSAERPGAIKIVGYLEKKGKLKVVTTWKKYWFVLEGRLLLYYRSQEEYENLSPCKGSINMGLVTNIRPGLAAVGIFQIITRTTTVTLRAKERSIQEKWLQALLDATGQQSASNPIKMSHFRYSMDDLIPTGAKQKQQNQNNQKPVLTRQNTLPYHFKVDRRNSIIERIRLIGGQTYCGSLDTINQIAQTKKMSQTDQNTSNKSLTDTETEETDIKNDLYSELFIENTQYIPANNNNDKSCYIIENDHYMKTDSVSLKNDGTSTQSEDTDDIEYYCTYAEVSSKTREPELPPRPEGKISETEDSACSVDRKKTSKFSRFARRFMSFNSDENGLKKRSASLIRKVIGKKKLNDQIISEPIYDTVDYEDLEKIETNSKNIVQDNLVKTLIDLQQTLETKKSQLKEIMETNPPSPIKIEDPAPQHEEVLYRNEDRTNNNLQPEDCNPPGLPPRRGSRPRSPFHDIPKSIPILEPSIEEEEETKDYTIDEILNDLELEAKNSKDEPSNNVRQLIEKFNHFEDDSDVLMRQKADAVESINRHSDELNKLLEELTKVTSAPLMTPGVTSSLVQMKSAPLTDEEWLAIAPIRRRRHSEPDYDVPRPHRSLQILPQSPGTEGEDLEITATRFFGPVLAPSLTNDKSYIEQSISWRSMTPDSLEPLQMLQAAMKQRRISSDIEKDRSVEFNITNNNVKEFDFRANDNFLDSLEPLSEGATAF